MSARAARGRVPLLRRKGNAVEGGCSELLALYDATGSAYSFVNSSGRGIGCRLAQTPRNERGNVTREPLLEPG
jgi:hypothetical protein